MDSITSLLEYKKQVIFQGPPGTGKTYLAKQIAKEMTKASSQGDPMQKIDDFFKTFDASSKEYVERNNHFKNLLSEFHSKFPLEKINSLTLEEYAIGTGENDSFCWWIERGLKPLGYYFPGTAKSYLIYWSEAKKDYSKHTRLVRDIDDNEEAMGLVSHAIYNLLKKEDYNEFKKIFGNSLMLKLLHSYYPQKYFPINSWRIIDKVLLLFGIDGKGLNVFEKNLKLQELFEQKKKEHNSGATSYDFMLFLFEDIGVKGDISIDSQEIVSKGKVKLIQFHPAYTYEDFVRGITVRVNEEKHPEYIVENRVLADFAEEAINNPKANYVLIIDEINRANLPAVLGELIYALEYRYDKNNPDETSVESMYSIVDSDNTPENFTEGKKLMLPDNLFIIGTMNTADRSVGHIDYAIRRRFAFVPVLPSINVISSVVKDAEVRQKAEKLFAEIEKLFTSDYIATDFDPKDIQIGHSYFLAQTLKELELKLEYEIKPILREYLKDGILNKANGTGKPTEDIIQELNV
jgi:MoxR-like ATPase